jgi:hypothetical protein
MTNNIQNLVSISIAQGKENSRTHFIGDVDGVYRCVNCEIGSWNAWKEACPAG